MNTQQLVDQVLSYEDIILSKGVAFKPHSEEDLLKLSEHDLYQLLRQVRDLARTPST